MKNALNWFEIPAADYERAKKFYLAIFDQELEEMEEGGTRMLSFPSDEEGVGGGLIEMKSMKPSADGTKVYLNGGDDLSLILDRVEVAGGKVVMPKKNIGKWGFIAMFMDTEGNTVGLHSMG